MARSYEAAKKEKTLKESLKRSGLRLKHGYEVIDVKKRKTKTRKK